MLSYFTFVSASIFISRTTIYNLAVHNVLAPYIGAVDGLNQSNLIRNVYRPWMTNSPLMAYTAILSSSGYQAEARGLDVSTHVEAIAIKVEIIKIINEYLKTSRGTVSDEAIAAVNHLLINEASFAPWTSPLDESSILMYN
jgi:hypothetical protein